MIALTLCCAPREPVSTDEGHCYEHAAIKEWLALSHISPSTGLQLQSAKLTPAHALRNSIQGTPFHRCLRSR